MVKLNRDRVVEEALALLDEVGIDDVSTRRLAQRLGVEQPALYWHFRNKAALLSAMAQAAMAPLAAAALPVPSDDWPVWFAENMRSFRRTLLMRRDGARLHAGSRPVTESARRLTQKIAFLTAAGIPEPTAQMAMLAAGRFTVGSVLEEQADSGADTSADEEDGPMPVDHDAAFEAGLAFFIRALESHAEANRHLSRSVAQPDKKPRR